MDSGTSPLWQRDWMFFLLFLLSATEVNKSIISIYTVSLLAVDFLWKEGINTDIDIFAYFNIAFLILKRDKRIYSMKTSLSQFTFPLRWLAQVPVLGAFLFCLGKEPNRSSFLALMNIVLLLVTVYLFAGDTGLLWSAAIFVGFIGLVVVALIHDYLFGKPADHQAV